MGPSPFGSGWIETKIFVPRWLQAISYHPGHTVTSSPIISLRVELLGYISMPRALVLAFPASALVKVARRPRLASVAGQSAISHHLLHLRIVAVIAPTHNEAKRSGRLQATPQRQLMNPCSPPSTIVKFAAANMGLSVTS